MSVHKLATGALLWPADSTPGGSPQRARRTRRIISASLRCRSCGVDASRRSDRRSHEHRRLPVRFFGLPRLTDTSRECIGCNKRPWRTPASSRHKPNTAIPEYVLDTPHGKVPLELPFVKGREGDDYVVEAWDGATWREPNPR